MRMMTLIVELQEVRDGRPVPFTGRHVQVELTPEQAAQIRPRMHDGTGKPLIEVISKCWVEE